MPLGKSFYLSGSQQVLSTFVHSPSFKIEILEFLKIPEILIQNERGEKRAPLIT